jgi:uncharacterized protein (DUF2336 family)
MRNKDVVLMATVTSFESLPHPSRSELRQFAELFSPLFRASSEEARRQAVAALSQSKTVPATVAFFIASQPIAVAAPFLAASPCLTNEALITIAKSQGVDHARAIVRRENLAPAVIDALVALRYERTALRTMPSAESAEPAHVGDMPADIEPSALDMLAGSMAEDVTATDTVEAALATAHEAERMLREDELRHRLKLMAGHNERKADDRLGLRTLSSVQAALLVRFARVRDAAHFAGVLSDTLSSSRWLAERVLLDVSGLQLATVLKGVHAERADATYVLTRFYDHLAETKAGINRVDVLWDGLDEDQCGRRLESWRLADRYTHAPAHGHGQVRVSEFAAGNTDAPSDEAIAAERRPLRTTASLRRAAGHRGR